MKHMSHRRGSAEAVAIICLVLALLAALGWIFWQNFVYKQPQDIQHSISNKPTAKSNSEKENPTIKTPAAEGSSLFSANDLENVKSVVKSASCGLDATNYEQVKILSDGYIDNSQIISASGAKQQIGQASTVKGAVTGDNKWVFLTGGCGTQAFGFVLKKASDNQWTLISKSGNTAFSCEETDGKGIPVTFMPNCYSFSENKDRKIK